MTTPHTPAPADEFCRAPLESVEIHGVCCELAYGHIGDHCSYEPITWYNAPAVVAGRGAAGGTT